MSSPSDPRRAQQHWSHTNPPPTQAPSYINPVIHANVAPGTMKPKGTNLTEGGFDEHDTRDTGEIGSKDDSGRRAEWQFEGRNAEMPGEAAAVVDKGVVEGGGAAEWKGGWGEGKNLKGGQPYGALGEEDA